jgi:hypothetical protein
MTRTVRNRLPLSIASDGGDRLVATLLLFGKLLVTCDGEFSSLN